MGVPFKFGDEILVKNAIAPLVGALEARQYASSVTALVDGRFVVSWTAKADGDEIPDNAIYAQILNAAGSKAGAEFLVSTTPASLSFNSELTGLDDGRFVVTWTGIGTPGQELSDRNVYAQVMNGDGSKAGPEVLVNTTTFGHQILPNITTLSDGRFVATWMNNSASGDDLSGYGINAQIFNADGSKVGVEFLINTTTLEDQYLPEITALSGGRFLVSWTDQSASGGDTSGWAVRAQIINADGSRAGGEFLVNTTTADNQQANKATALKDGRFVITWTDSSASGDDTSSAAVRAQIFNGDGSKVGGEFLVNTSTNSGQADPSITTLSDGRFVISWQDLNWVGTSIVTLRAQVFEADGSKVGGEFLAITDTHGIPRETEITALADGRFVITWKYYITPNPENSVHTIRAQIFDPREAAVTLAGSALDDDFVGTRYGDTLSGVNGDDVLQGRAGDDELRGGAGHDILKGGTGDDHLFGGAGNDRLNGGTGIDQMTGGEGDDRYSVDNVGDVVIENAGEGLDMIRSGVLDLDLADFANVENLRLTGTADLALTGNGLNNVLKGNAGDNVIHGNGGDDKIVGGEGDDGLFGGNGNDILRGMAGGDTLTGGLGRDQLIGGTGADRFVFNSATESGTAANTRDSIRDFSQGDGDMIDLSGIDASSADGDQAFAFIGTSAFSSVEGQLRFFQTANRSIVQGDVDGDGVADFEIQLNGLVNLIAGDFVL